MNLIVQIKNVPEVTLKVFEFNTETYFKQKLIPFDTSIDLTGMIPSTQRTESFADIPKNKKFTHVFNFPELDNKSGIFIIEL